jgi:hypothetical protein
MDKMRLIIEQMVRHVAHFESTDLATRIDGDLASQSDGGTARLLFIPVLDWMRARATSGRPSVMRLPNYPWAAKLKGFLQAYPELSEVFQIRNDELDFASTVPAEDVRWAEAYVAETYKPVAMR